jgi:hypothetical protein
MQQLPQHELVTTLAVAVTCKEFLQVWQDGSSAMRRGA